MFCIINHYSRPFVSGFLKFKCLRARSMSFSVCTPKGCLTLNSNLWIFKN